MRERARRPSPRRPSSTPPAPPPSRSIRMRSSAHSFVPIVQRL
jgi:hypothetical protein